MFFEYIVDIGRVFWLNSYIGIYKKFLKQRGNKNGWLFWSNITAGLCI